MYVDCNGDDYVDNDNHEQKYFESDDLVDDDGDDEQKNVDCNDDD
jgi:hypothetical protein